MFLQKRPADGPGRVIARRKPDAFLAREGDGVTLHGGRWRTGAAGPAGARPQQGRPAARRAVLQLADDAFGDVAHRVNGLDHLLFADHDFVQQAFKLRGHAGVDQGRISLPEDAEEFQPGVRGDDVFPLRDQKALSLQSADDFRPGCGRADALGLLQALAQMLVLHEAPGVLHGLDQRALIVTRGRTGFLVFDLRVQQLSGLAVLHHREKLRVVALFIGGRPLGEGRAPAKINGLTPRGLEGEARDIQRRCRLPVAKVRHDRGQIGSCDHIEQFLLVEREPWPDLPQAVHRVDVGDDRVMAGALQALVTEGSMGAFADHQRRRHGDLLERLAHLKACDDLCRIRDQIFRQIAHLGAGIGDDLLALAVIERLGDLQRLGRRPAKPGGAELLQRGEVVKLGRSLFLVLDADAQRAPEPLGRLGDQIRVLAFEDPLLRGMAHLEGAGLHVRGGDHLEIGHGREVADLQLAFAHNRQGGGLDPSHPDDPARALAQDDRRRAGQGEVVDLVRLAPGDGGCVELRIFGVWPGPPEGVADGLGILRGEEDPPNLTPILVMIEDLLADQLALPVAVGGEPHDFGGSQRLADRLELGGLVPAIGWLGGVEALGTQQNGRPALPFGHGVLGLFKIQQVPLGGKNVAISGPYGGPYVLGLTGFLGDDDLISHLGP